MYLVGFIIRIYDDARSPERQIHWINLQRLSTSLKRRRVLFIVPTLHFQSAKAGHRALVLPY